MVVWIVLSFWDISSRVIGLVGVFVVHVYCFAIPVIEDCLLLLSTMIRFLSKVMQRVCREL